MLCSYTSPRYQVSVYRAIGPLVIINHLVKHLFIYSLALYVNFPLPPWVLGGQLTRTGSRLFLFVSV